MRKLFDGLFRSGAPRNAFLMGMLLFSIPIFVSAGFAQYPRTHYFIGALLELSSKFGDALIIAALLIAVVDEESRLKLIATVVRAASPKLIARHLPEPVQDAVFRYFRIYLYRPELRVHYDLEPISATGVLPEHMKVTMRITGTFSNCGDDKNTFPFYGETDPPVLAGLPDSYINAAKIYDEKGALVFEYKTGSSLLKNEGGEAFEHKFTLAKSLKYSTIFEAVSFRPTAYFLPLFLGSTVVQATVRVRYPKARFNVNIQLSTVGGDEPQPDPTHDGAEWQIREPLLPGNCILMTFNPVLLPKGA